MRILIILAVFAFPLLSAAQQDSLFVTTSDSVKLFVKRSGKGLPMLVIHGGPGSNSFYLEKEGLEVFNQEVQLIYLDQRGCGRSDTASDYSLARLVKDFEEVRTQLGIQQWLVMPHSFGGIMATEYAYRHPSSIKAMIYLNCTVNIAHSAKNGIAKTISILRLTEQEKNYLQNDSVPLLERWGNAFWHLRNQDMAYALMFDKKENYKYDSALINVPFLKYHMGGRVFNYAEYFEDYSAKTRAIKMPVLVITGTRDFTIGVDHYQLMQFPVQQVKFVAGGHALYLEQNKELYTAIAPFLKAQSRS